MEKVSGWAWLVRVVFLYGHSEWLMVHVALIVLLYICKLLLSIVSSVSTVLISLACYALLLAGSVACVKQYCAWLRSVQC